eukprot:gene23875-27015_t
MDLEYFIETISFWKVPYLPRELYAYTFDNEVELFEEIYKKYSDKLKYLDALIAVRKSANPTVTAIEH